MNTFSFKNVVLCLLMCVWQYSEAKRTAPIPVAKHLSHWFAQAATETANGFVIVGAQSLSDRRSKMVVTYTDSIGSPRWTRTYPQLKGEVEAYSVASDDSNQLWVGGRQNGDAKIWQIDSKQNGRIARTISLDTGCVRSIKTTHEGRLVVAVEQGHFVKIIKLNANGSIHWERKWNSSKKAKSHLMITREGWVMVAFGGHSYALDKNGQTIWSYHNEAALWRGLYQRANGEVLLVGQQKTQLFGPVNDEAYVVSVRPLLQKFEWFKSYGTDETFDTAYQVAERPNGQLVILTRQNRRLRLLELNQNLSIGKINWLTGSLSNEHLHPVGMLAQSAWQDKWLIVCNHPDGSVWLYPSRTQETSEALPSHLSFEVTAKNAKWMQVSLTPIAEVPPTFKFPTDSGSHSLLFTHCQGDGYAYLLQRPHHTEAWEEKSWVQLGSSDSLHFQLSSNYEYLVLVTKRPFAAPLQLLLKSDAYSSDQLHPENPMGSLHEQYPTTFNEFLQINISANGNHFEIAHLSDDGWLPLLFRTSEKKISYKQ
ncbi:hypothetical protein [Runella salmonicolor]|uniref:WD40 repeat domain-containing protein n=1 Tax=Runella salmonicolor TaxID=2950278 RepID=A0ABT1FWV5_9BACT|nr:hypothetical protein [Runella salmonicolor]MCP1386249.1 hypothetical protein [Runella salmonicolor]